MAAPVTLTRREARRLANLVREWMRADDQTTVFDIGATEPAAMLAWVEEFAARRPAIDLSREWSGGALSTPEARAHFAAKWPRLRGVTMEERARRFAERRNAREVARAGLFADALEEVGGRLVTPDALLQQWRKGYERGREAVAQHGVRHTSVADDHARRWAQVDPDKPVSNGLSLNGFRVWRWLLRYGAAPDAAAALDALRAAYPNAATDSEQRARLRATLAALTDHASRCSARARERAEQDAKEGRTPPPYRDSLDAPLFAAADTLAEVCAAVGFRPLPTAAPAAAQSQEEPRYATA